MNVTATPAPKSAIKLEVELPPERLQQAINEAVRHLSRRTKVPGFRPGKAPRAVLERVLAPGAVLDDAIEHLVQDAYRKALIEKEILPLANADVEIVQAEEGKPVIFTALVPVRPDVTLGDYRNFNFQPEIEQIDDPRVDKVIEELRDQNATLAPVEDRGAKEGDYTVIRYTGTRDGTPFEGGSSDRMPLILGQERLIPGFEANLNGLKVGDTTEFDITFPEDYGEETLAGQQAHFEVGILELREKILPEADDEFAQSLGDYASLDALKVEVRKRLERNALDRARHDFADRIVEYAVANATVELPDVLVEQEVEVMHDEFRSSLAQQGIDEASYLKVVEKSEKDLHDEFRPRAEHRVKVLLVLSKIAEDEGLTVSEDEIEAEIARARVRYADEPRVLRQFESDRGRNFIRSSLRRTRLVEKFVDEWLAAHPDHPALPHVEDAAEPETGAVEAEATDAETTDTTATDATTDVSDTEPTREPASTAG
jgi:trigger factor